MKVIVVKNYDEVSKEAFNVMKVLQQNQKLFQVLRLDQVQSVYMKI